MTFPPNNLTTTRKELTSFINLVVPYFEIKNKPYLPPPPSTQNYFLFFFYARNIASSFFHACTLLCRKINVNIVLYNHIYLFHNIDLKDSMGCTIHINV
jgi:hypothetical protein